MLDQLARRFVAIDEMDECGPGQVTVGGLGSGCIWSVISGWAEGFAQMGLLFFLGERVNDESLPLQHQRQGGDRLLVGQGGDPLGQRDGTGVMDPPGRWWMSWSGSSRSRMASRKLGLVGVQSR